MTQPPQPGVDSEVMTSSLSTAGPSAGIPVHGTVIVGIGLLASQLISMSQMLVVSRLLGPVQFGAFGAIAVVLLLGSTALAATQLVLARHVAAGGVQGHVGLRQVLVVGVVTTALGLAATPFLSGALNLDNSRALAYAALTFTPLTVTGAQLGLLQGAELHRRLAVLYVLSTAGRVTGGIMGAATTRTADGALLGLALGATCAAVAGDLLVPKRESRHGSVKRSRALLAEVFHAAHALVALSALTNIDMLLARAQLSAHDAGLYAAGALVARAVFFLPMAVLVAAFPRMVVGSANARRQAVRVVVGMGLVATAAVALLPGLFVQILAGSQYQAVAGDAWIFALAGAGFSVVQVLLYARMAGHDRRIVGLLWAGVAALLALGLALGTSIQALATCAAAVAWSVALAGLTWGWWESRSPGRAWQTPRRLP